LNSGRRGTIACMHGPFMKESRQDGRDFQFTPSGLLGGIGEGAVVLAALKLSGATIASG